ncbi:TetR/AcrR family transcriptional regulator [Streptomyces lancefieldiae]|uniref:TetR/AcrR family transcriptional regulator n=1 Tax=Streptomyces lancefieldiae TaxID=3075520 RepID=A0ABU3AW61_9ACTN|nr:TetR/AcrR family transcriptional regulator [Streptomyces sp. DSM 40712]MDT0614060.1 TetR/AcrR family transcriptional regulator [Streptomyces sp. DSM 40712]
MSTSPQRARKSPPAASAPKASPAKAAGPRRRADAARNIAAIVDAALDCFRKDPGASLTAVANAAGVSRVTLYAHFPSREALLAAVLAHSVERADAALAAQRLEEGDAGEAFSRLVRSSWGILEQHAFLLSIAEGTVPASQLRKHHAKVLGRVEAVLGRGQEEGAFRTDLPTNWLVTTFYSLLHAAALEGEQRHLKKKEIPGILDRTLTSILRADSA